MKTCGIDPGTRSWDLVVMEDGVVSDSLILPTIEIKKDDLRLQIERELRGKLIYLREGFLNTAKDRRSLYEMLSKSVPTFISIFSALLYLKDEPLPQSRAKVFERTAELFGLQNSIFTELINIKNGQWHGSKVQLHDLTMAYIKQISKLIDLVDQM